MEDDLYSSQYQTFEDLRRYCYRVASTVGLCLVEIYGYNDPNARRHAVEMGIYLQWLTCRIFKKISAEIEYIFQQKNLPNSASRSRFEMENSHPLTAGKNSCHYLDHVMMHRKNAVGLLSLLDKDARYSPSLMCAAYDAILEEAMKRNGDVFTRRLSMSFYRKLQFALGIIRKPRLNF